MHFVKLPLVTIDEIRDLIGLANESGVAELEVQRGENRVRIRRASFAGSEVVIGSSTVMPVMAAPATVVAAPATVAAPAPTPVAAPAAAETVKTSAVSKPAADPGLTLVKSPIQ